MDFFVILKVLVTGFPLAKIGRRLCGLNISTPSDSRLLIILLFQRPDNGATSDFLTQKKLTPTLRAKRWNCETEGRGWPSFFFPFGLGCRIDLVVVIVRRHIRAGMIDNTHYKSWKKREESFTNSSYPSIKLKNGSSQ